MPVKFSASRLGVGVLLFVAGMGLAACEGDFVTDPSRPRVVRNLGTPYGVADASSEVMRVDSGAFSILTVDIPNNRNEPSVAHWGEPLPTNYGGQGVAPQPALVPQTEPAKAPPQPKDRIIVVGQLKPADFYSISRDDGDNADLWVTCPSGIGSVTLERNADTWPALLRVHLRYDADRPFQGLETIGAAELLPATRAADTPQPAASAPAAGAIGPGIVGGGAVPLKTTYEKNANIAQVAIPGFSRASRIQITWIDAPPK